MFEEPKTTVCPYKKLGETLRGCCQGYNAKDNVIDNNYYKK